MYLDNPESITWRVRKVFAAAGFKDAEANGDGQSENPGKAPNESAVMADGGIAA